MMKKHICVLGGGGFVGSHLVSRLVSEGWQVTLPTRRRQRIKNLLVLPTVEVVEADIHDPASLNQLCAGQDAVINLVGILHGSQQDFLRAHVKLPHKLMEACRISGVTRLLHMSALGADVNSKSFYQHSKGEGEKLLLAPARDHVLDITVFRPSVIFGPGDSFLNLFADLLKLAPIVPLANAGARFQPVHVSDVARAFVDAIDDPETYGQAYELCGARSYSLEELVRLVADTLGLKRVILPLDSGLSYWFARLMELKPGRKLMTRDNHYAMQTDNVCQQNNRPPRLSAPLNLEANIDYLSNTGTRGHYDSFRGNAGR